MLSGLINIKEDKSLGSYRIHPREARKEISGVLRKSKVPEDYRIVSIDFLFKTSMVMKCFDRLVMAHINFYLKDVNSLQFAERHYRSTGEYNLTGSPLGWTT